MAEAGEVRHFHGNLQRHHGLALRLHYDLAPTYPRIGPGNSRDLTVEVVITDIQAARGTTSHFNVGNPLDATLFSIMGTFIGVLWLTSIVVLVALFRQSFFNAAWGWALRTGMFITVIGMGSGGMMLRPTPPQLDQIKTSSRPQLVGGHTVGAVDGGPGVPGVGWSRSHGDLRIPHFFGLHAVQIIPFFAFLLAHRGLSTRRQTILVCLGAGSYMALFVIMCWQALRGQSILQPDTQTMAALAAWIVATGVAAAVSLGRLSSWRQAATAALR